MHHCIWSLLDHLFFLGALLSVFFLSNLEPFIWSLWSEVWKLCVGIFIGNWVWNAAKAIIWSIFYVKLILGLVLAATVNFSLQLLALCQLTIVHYLFLFLLKDFGVWDSVARLGVRTVNGGLVLESIWCNAPFAAMPPKPCFTIRKTSFAQDRYAWPFFLSLMSSRLCVT